MHSSSKSSTMSQGISFSIVPYFKTKSMYAINWFFFNSFQTLVADRRNLNGSFITPLKWNLSKTDRRMLSSHCMPDSSKGLGAEDHPSCRSWAPQRAHKSPVTQMLICENRKKFKRVKSEFPWWQKRFQIKGTPDLGQALKSSQI